MLPYSATAMSAFYTALDRPVAGLGSCRPCGHCIYQSPPFPYPSPPLRLPETGLLGCRPCTEHKGPTLEPPLKVRCHAHQRFMLASCSTCRFCLSSSKVLYLRLSLLSQGGACIVDWWHHSNPTAWLTTAQQDAGKGLLLVQETWEAMEAIHAKGLARNIGVSNWSIKKTDDMLKYAKVVPAVNQVRASFRGVWLEVVLHTAMSYQKMLTS